MSAISFQKLECLPTLPSSLRVLTFRGMESGPVTRAEQAWCPCWFIPHLLLLVRSPGFGGQSRGGGLNEDERFSLLQRI